MSGAKMPWFELNNGVEIPSVLMGCYQGSFGKEAKGLEEAIKVGYRGLDTATMYQNEEAVGEAVRKSGIPRSEFFVTSEFNVEYCYDVVTYVRTRYSQIEPDVRRVSMSAAYERASLYLECSSRIVPSTAGKASPAHSSARSMP